MMRLKTSYNWTFNEEVLPLLSIDGYENLEKIVRILRDLEEQLEPAMTIQRIRDEWDELI